ncbi:hypothetical protein BD324DRAFT_631111 [Kockovaella imperatae]|uniref:Uncharacterized protein n=1 Tax=Kockovaella imperatae TaxID=4999 RepID=A0A1Y1UCD8_9TREE|nr:hypothetical protein BD324DRAFT_631111 [Kockovaella imperatae]ORX35679.1 hypothetical protein BD324DRAFT_631111 [Kockovaella imperatae]
MADNLQPPSSTSRSSSPGSGDPKPRVISGSLKDRIAKFNNPSAAPLVPNHPFGQAGSRNVSGSTTGGGMIGNRLPALDPKTAGIVSSGQRRTKEDRGIIGNRIPSFGRDTSSMPEPKSAGARSSDGAPSTGHRAASPASLDSSSASGLAESANSPNTSRSSSPPTSTPDEDLPNVLLSAEHLEGGTGAMTPSSTRADAGEDTGERSAPSTPVQGPVDPSIRGGHYDLIAPNLKLAAANQNPEVSLTMNRGPSLSSIGGLAAPSVTASLGSSRASQYDPSSQGSENPEKMMRDVSEISTPTGTPKAEPKDLDFGSTRGSVAGDETGDTTARLEGLDINAVDRDPTPEPPHVTSPTPKDEEIIGAPLEEDPNKAKDLEDLKQGNLSHEKHELGTHTVDQNPINNIAEAGVAQGLAEHDIAPDELRAQGGPAGQRLEEIETADEVKAPTSQGSKSQGYAGSSELDVQTLPTEAESTSTDVGSDDGLSLSNVVEGARAAGTRLDEAGAGQTTSENTDRLKEELAEERKKKGDREGVNEQQDANLQTEEDRDEGMSRKEQLIKALDQNADPDKNLEGGADDGTKEKAKEATMTMTGAKPMAEDETEEVVNDDEGGDNGGQGDKGGNKDDVKVEDTTESHEEQEDDNQDGGKTPTSDRRGSVIEQQVVGTSDKDKAATDQEDSTDGSHQPIQVQVEPAPIAQPAQDDADQAPDQPGSVRSESVTPTPSLDNPPNFPEPPTDDPDVVDPVSSTTGSDQEAAGTSTPIDSSVMKSFPDVPDEDHPRVQVHVHSPLSTPFRNHSNQNPMDTPGTSRGSASTEETPIAKIPGHSKSLSYPSELTGTNEELGGSPDVARRDSLGITGTPVDQTDNGSGLAKRASTRRSPKSPLLDDEDPGDFQGGDGWAVIHDQPGRNRE